MNNINAADDTSLLSTSFPLPPRSSSPSSDADRPAPDILVPVQSETPGPLAGISDVSSHLEMMRRMDAFARRRAALDREEREMREQYDLRDMPPHLEASPARSDTEVKPLALREGHAPGSSTGGDDMAETLLRLESRMSQGLDELNARIREIDVRSRSPFSPDPSVVVDRPRYLYGRTPPPARIPYDLAHPQRQVPKTAEMDPRVKMTAPPAWKGVFNDHAALELFIDSSRGYYLAVGKLSSFDALTTEAIKFFVASLFSTEKIGGLAAQEWLRSRFASVQASRKYTLEDLYDDMRSFWSDPTYGERMLVELHSLRQGTSPANVYGALHLALTAKCDAAELTPALVVRVFLKGLNSIVEQHVRLKIHEEKSRFAKLGHAFVPSHDEMVDWASACDPRLIALKSSVSVSAVSSVRFPPYPPPSSVSSSSIPSSSRKVTRPLWETGAARFQARFPIAERSTWPLGRTDPPSDGVNCWNCGGRGHWSLNCTNARVLPAVAVLASIAGGWVESERDERDDVVDEFAEYGRAREDDSVGDDLMGFA